MTQPQPSSTENKLQKETKAVVQDNISSQNDTALPLSSEGFTRPITFQGNRAQTHLRQSPASVLALQRTIGNHATRQLVQQRGQSADHPIQRSLSYAILQEAQNTAPIGANPGLQATARRQWFQGLLRAEIRRILKNPNFSMVNDLPGLAETNYHAYSVLEHQLKNADIKFNRLLNEGDMITINGILNSLEEAVDPSKVAPTNIKDTYIGNEFTFVNDALANVVGEDKDIIHEGMKEPYNNIVQEWFDAMTARGMAPVQDYMADGLRKLKYTFEADRHGIAWEYQVTPDQKCVEIITQKAKASDIYSGYIGNLMDDFLFGVANEIHLRADALIGGGHINVDEESAFGATGTQEESQHAAKVLANFMIQFYNDEQYWKAIDPDSHNSPFPSELDTTKQGKNQPKTSKMDDFQTIIGQFNQHHWTLAQLADRLLTNVFNISNVSNKANEAPHYQALNIEHLKTLEAQGTRRLEVRRVPAQPNRDALITQLNKIEDTLRIAKENAG